MKTFLCLFLCCTAAFALPTSDNPGMYGDKIQGDKLPSPEQKVMLQGKGRTGLIDKNYRWPDNTVPYVFVDNLDGFQTYMIQNTLRIMEKSLCLKFVMWTGQKDYIRITSREKGCFSMLGRQGGSQQLNLQWSAPFSGCFYYGTIAHEFIHALGFDHMHSASERDKYVEILWDNIEDKFQYAFNKFDESIISQFGVPYDYESVMHYGTKAFSKNGKETIRSKTNEKIRPSDFLTELDYQRIRKMYC